jgi:hypothetical protein
MVALRFFALFQLSFVQYSLPFGWEHGVSNLKSSLERKKTKLFAAKNMLVLRFQSPYTSIVQNLVLHKRCLNFI